jgi:hypothetical protein
MMKRLVAPIHAILLVVNLVAQPVGQKTPRGSVSRFAKMYASLLGIDELIGGVLDMP